MGNDEETRRQRDKEREMKAENFVKTRKGKRKESYENKEKIISLMRDREQGKSLENKRSERKRERAKLRRERKEKLDFRSSEYNPQENDFVVRM